MSRKEIISAPEGDDGDLESMPRRGIVLRGLSASVIAVLAVSAVATARSVGSSDIGAAVDHVALPPPAAVAPVTRAVAPALQPVATPHAYATPPARRSSAQRADPRPAGYGCAAALAYLRTHAAPGFQLRCPGYAYGHQAMSCADQAPQCPGKRIIAIAVPCRAAYMNEASNSWVVAGLRRTTIDPYGFCH